MNKLVPWRRGRKDLAARDDENHPILRVHSDVDRLFDDLFTAFDRQWDFGLIPSRFGGGFTEGAIIPKIDVAEDGKEITLTAELPGLDEKDVELLLSNNGLTIKGEKKSQQEKKGKDYCRVERSYGSFSRTIPMPEGIDVDKVEASFNPNYS
ncbi:MAG: Hsp20/alpha crystallin family protein [Nitrospinota bacterium]